MGIQLTDFERSMIEDMANFRRDDMPVYPYFFGYMSGQVEMFLVGNIDAKKLAEVDAFCSLLLALWTKCTEQELRDIASGAMELPGEDVPSGQ